MLDVTCGLSKGPLFWGAFLFLFAWMAPLCVLAGQAGIGGHPEMEINVAIDVEAHTVSGTAYYKIAPNSSAVIDLTGLEIHEVTLPAANKSTNVLKLESGEKGMQGLIGFSLKLPSVQGAFFQKDPTLSGSYIDSQGAALFGHWFPRFEGLAYYTLKARVPGHWLAVSEADSIDKAGLAWGFDFPYPREEVSLVAGPYIKSKTTWNNVSIEAYFFPEDSDLAQDYVAKARHFLALYSEMIGTYPFKRFAIVENRLPTGYGFASFTLLGQKVARLPFIADTSLGHEILHSWFGNSVYVGRGGNWSEGLTTYLADHLYEEKRGKGASYRHNALVEYQSYIHGHAPFTLSEFTYRMDRPAKAVGYIRGFMLFHMLRQHLGEENFYNGVRLFYKKNKFSRATFDDLRLSFQNAAHEDLKWFFDQWLQRVDVPIIEVTSYETRPTNDNKWRVTLSLEQLQERPYRLEIPVKIETKKGLVHKTIAVDSKHSKAQWKVEGQPVKLAVDPSCQLMWHLDYREFPPVLHRLFGAEDKFIVPPSGEDASSFVAAMNARGFIEKERTIFNEKGKAKGSYLILGNMPPGLEAISKRLAPRHDGAWVEVFENPYDTRNVIAVLGFSSAHELDFLISKLQHYGKYTTLHFKGGRAVKKEVAPFDKGIEITLSRETTWMASQALSPFDSLVKELEGRRVVFVGEKHDEFSHHLTQKRIIEALFNAGIKLAVGMEMFQRPFQDALDKFTGGQIDEDEMLRKTEYFKRWGYDYHLYSPILRYCREKKIPVVALNLRSEISKKVARQGIDALSQEEKRELPASIDWTKDQYRQVLRDIYSQHGNSLPDFDHFYQAQVLWDETMAESIYEYLRAHPDRKMVVLAGSGHVLYRLGIPCRAERRGAAPQAVIALSADSYNANKEMADFFLFPGHIEAPFSAKLGVYLDETAQGLVIKQVSPGSPADAAGIKAGDMLVEFDSRAIPDITELKLALLKKDEGDHAVVKVKRSRKLLPDKEIELKVGPFRPLTASPHQFSPHKAQPQKKEERSEEQP